MQLFRKNRESSQEDLDKCQKLHADCGNELATAKSFMQIAATNWQLPKASCKLQQRIGNCQKLHANCGKELATAKSFMQIAAKNWQFWQSSANSICIVPDNFGLEPFQTSAKVHFSARKFGQLKTSFSSIKAANKFGDSSCC